MKPLRASSHPKRCFFVDASGETVGGSIIDLKLSDMWGKFVQVRQLHIVAKEMTQMGVGIVRHRELTTLKHMSGQREYLIQITRVMEGNAHGAGDE